MLFKTPPRADTVALWWPRPLVSGAACVSGSGAKRRARHNELGHRSFDREYADLGAYANIRLPNTRGCGYCDTNLSHDPNKHAEESNHNVAWNYPPPVQPEQLLGQRPLNRLGNVDEIFEKCAQVAHSPKLYGEAKPAVATGAWSVSSRWKKCPRAARDCPKWPAP